jgi:glucokinase
MAADIPNAKEVEARLKPAVPTGSSRMVIEKALQQQGLAATYDSFTRRYQGIIRSPSTERHAVVVYVYLDSEDKSSKLEVRDSYTGP